MNSFGMQRRKRLTKQLLLSHSPMPLLQICWAILGVDLPTLQMTCNLYPITPNSFSYRSEKNVISVQDDVLGAGEEGASRGSRQLSDSVRNNVLHQDYYISDQNVVRTSQVSQLCFVLVYVMCLRSSMKFGIELTFFFILRKCEPNCHSYRNRQLSFENGKLIIQS